jgi:hypothetical protein
MGSKPGSSQRSRNDTKTLVRLGTEGGPAPAALTPAQRELLQDIARGDAGDTRVQLWFKGLIHPVRARLRVQGGRIQLETSLAFLEVDSKVGVARSDDALARIDGRIARVSLVANADEPVPRLCVDLALPGEVATSSARPEQSEVTSTPPVSIAPAIPARGHGVLTWTLAFLLGLAGGAAGSWGWLAPWLRHPFGRLSQLTQASAGALDQGVSVPAPAATVQPEPAPTGAALAVLLAFPESEQGASPLAFAAPAPIVHATPIDATRDAFELEREIVPVTTASSADAAPAVVAAPAVQAPNERVEVTHGFEIRERAALTEIVLPMQGSAEALERHPLTATPGLALNLPNARAGVPLDDYATPHHAAVRHVWLRRQGIGVQVRIFYPKAPLHDEERFDDRGLHVLLRP